MADTFSIQQILRSLHIKLRRFDFPDSTLFLCRAPDDTAFNLMVEADETVQLWRYLPAELPQAGHRLLPKAAAAPISLYLDTIDQTHPALCSEFHPQGSSAAQQERLLRTQICLFLLINTWADSSRHTCDHLHP